MAKRRVVTLLNLRVQRAIKGKVLNDEQLAEVIANEVINLMVPLPKAA